MSHRGPGASVGGEGSPRPSPAGSRQRPGSPHMGDAPCLLAATCGAYMAVFGSSHVTPGGALWAVPPGSSGPACSGRAPVSGRGRGDLAPPALRGVVTTCCGPKPEGPGGRRRPPHGGDFLLADLARGPERGQGGCRASSLGGEGALSPNSSGAPAPRDRGEAACPRGLCHAEGSGDSRVRGSVRAARLPGGVHRASGSQGQCPEWARVATSQGLSCSRAPGWQPHSAGGEGHC